jgi:hypothetical protein
MTVELNITEKRVIFYILSLIMKADNILNPAEIKFLDSVFEKFELDVSEFDHMDDLSFDKLYKDYALFSPKTKKYANTLFREMAECDGYVHPKEAAIIEQLFEETV